VVFDGDVETDDQWEVFSVPIGGGPVTRLSGPLGGEGDTVWFVVGALGRVVYVADQETDEEYELFIVPAAGGGTTKLNGPLTAGGDVAAMVGDFQITPDGQRVVYRADQDTDGQIELYATLDDSLLPGGMVFVPVVSR
jgi:hypothetical protein